MAEFPALPLWTDAYLADTRHLSTLEHGAYLLLLIEAWRRPSCDLPDDDRLLARLAGVTVEDWAGIKPIIMDMWTFDGRRRTWTQKRLKKERDYVALKSQSQRDRAAKRWKKTKKGNATAMPDGCPRDAPTPTPTPTPNKKKEPPSGVQKKASPVGSARAHGARLPDDWVLPKEWKDWAIAEGVDELTIHREAEKFRDYWHAQAGQKARKADWQATWRNWIRRAAPQPTPERRRFKV